VLAPSYHAAVSRGATVLLVFITSTCVGLYFATQTYFNPALQGMVRLDHLIAVNLIYYYLWGLAVPVIITIARRVPFDERRRAAPLLIHLLASILIASVIIIFAELALKWIPGKRGTMQWWEAIRYAFGVNFHSLLPTYWMILFAYLAFQYYARYRDREMRATQLEARLSEARLDALKMQLRPHFLFNTLNSISSLMYVDVDAADAMVTKLGDFLRLTIEGDGRQLVPLRQELDFVRRYLEIEEIRFEQRLRVDYEIDPQSMDALVPSLILQPLVENAIHHGIADREEGGRISIRASEAAGRLTMTIEDDGPGLGSGEPERVRFGLGATRARLEQLYGTDHELRFANGSRGGLSVDVVIPYRVAEERS
jgi:hypothetical protein